MPTVPVYSQEGTQTGELDLDPRVFGVVAKGALLHQAVVAQRANARRAIAHTKTRGEVRGGGKKPWAQKHTGRARAGSSRSPLWVGGGTTFGPRSTRNFSLGFPAPMRRAALRMAVSDKVASKRFLVLEDLVLPQQGTTKAAKRVLDTVAEHAAPGTRAPSVLLVLPADRRDVAKGVRNLSRVTGIAAAHLNTVDVLGHDCIVATRSAVAKIVETFVPKQ